jgi:hypothetical protein
MLGLLLGATLAMGCSAESAVGSGLDNVRETKLVEAHVGDSLELEFDSGDSFLFSISMAEQDSGFAAVMRVADDSGLDSYLRLYPAQEGPKIAESTYLQALLPMAEESDAVIVHRNLEELGSELLLFAGDLDLETAGLVQLDLVPLSSAPRDLSLTGAGPGALALMAVLREHEHAVISHLETGALTEGQDGWLVADLTRVPLSERNPLRELASRVNDVRSQLYALWAEQGASEEEVATVCSELWRSLRSDTFALDR